MGVTARCLIIRAGEVLILPALLATPAELASGVQNIEALCEHVAGRYLRARHAQLTDDLFADLTSYLMLRAWHEAGRYAPRDSGSDLVGYLCQRLAWRCTDWYRTTFGRDQTRPRPIIVSLNQHLDELHAAEAEETDPDEPVAA